MLVLRCRTRAFKLWWVGPFSSCGAWAPQCGGLRAAEHGAPGCARLRSCRWALGPGLSSCGAWASCSAAHRDPPRQGIQPMSPALPEFLTTSPPGNTPFLTYVAGHMHSEYNFFQLYTHVLRYVCVSAHRYTIWHNFKMFLPLALLG